MSEKKILLTGATGFLGSNLLKSLLASNCDVVIAKRSFSDAFRIEDIIDKCRVYDIDKINLEEIFKENKIDTIIHCATNYGREDINPLNVINANLTFPLDLLHFGLEYGLKTFINTDTIIDKNINHYSLSKKHFREWLKTYSDELKIVNLSLEHFYGAYDNETKFVMYVVKNLLNKVEELNLTSGIQQRDFIYVDDVLSAFMTVIKYIDNLPNNYNHFEIGTGHSMSIKDFVLLCKDLTENSNTKLNFGKIAMRKNEVLDYKVDISGLEKLNWHAKYDLKQGLIKMIEEMKKDRGIL